MVSRSVPGETARYEAIAQRAAVRSHASRAIGWPRRRPRRAQGSHRYLRFSRMGLTAAGLANATADLSGLLETGSSVARGLRVSCIAGLDVDLNVKLGGRNTQSGCALGKIGRIETAPQAAVECAAGSCSRGTPPVRTRGCSPVVQRTCEFRRASRSSRLATRPAPPSGRASRVARRWPLRRRFDSD